MGIISKMKNAFSSTDTKLEGWTILTEQSQVQEIIEASENRPQLVYKHSHTCGICIMAKRKIDDAFDEINEKAAMNFVNVIKERPVSNALAKQFNIRHESPQVLLIDEGKVVWDESHHAIKGDAILEALNNKVHAAA